MKVVPAMVVITLIRQLAPQKILSSPSPRRTT
jgi:hypothetical protein